MKRSLAHVTGDLGELSVERALISFGWTPNRLHRDEGIDFFVHGAPYTPGNAPKPGSTKSRKRLAPSLAVRPLFLAQVKTFGAHRANRAVLRLEVEDLLDWSRTPLLVLIFVVDADSGNMVVIDTRSLVSKLDHNCGDRWRKQLTKSIRLPQFEELPPKRWRTIEKRIRDYCDALENTVGKLRPSVTRSRHELRIMYHRTSPRLPSASTLLFEARLHEAFPEQRARAWVRLFTFARPGLGDPKGLSALIEGLDRKGPLFRYLSF